MSLDAHRVAHRGAVLLVMLTAACSASRPLSPGVLVSERSSGLRVAFELSPEEAAEESARAADETSFLPMRATHMPEGAVPPGLLHSAPDDDSASPALQTWYGAESRHYPAGWIGTFLVERPVNTHETVLFTAGANHTDRDDFGEHDDEEGSGYGVGAGYRHYFGEQLDGWFLGARLELWMLTIDWTDHPGKPNKKTGTSDVYIAQPTADLGYGFRLDERSRVNVFVSGGMEINVHTSGKNVGEGPIGLVGVSWVYGF